MKNSVVYLTRKCPRHCTYCSIRDSIGVGKELTPKQWVHAFRILKELNVEFNLILGNEPWLLGINLPMIMKHSTPYALYTSCAMTMFDKYKELYFDKGKINNFSTGVDFPLCAWRQLPIRPIKDDSWKKSVEAWKKIKWVRKHYPKVQVHATITVHKLNFMYLPLMVNQLTALGAYSNINFIHWNKGGGYDFFPKEKVIEHLLFEELSDYADLRWTLNKVLENPGLLQNPEMLQLSIGTLVGMGWHCKGDPYGGPTIDSDGTLRVCGYRKGKYTPKYTIFDLPEHLDVWEEAVRVDAMECPGCSWSCPWMFHYWKRTDPTMGKKVFEVHAIKNKSDERN